MYTQFAIFVYYLEFLFTTEVEVGAQFAVKWTIRNTIWYSTRHFTGFGSVQTEGTQLV